MSEINESNIEATENNAEDSVLTPPEQFDMLGHDLHIAGSTYEILERKGEDSPLEARALVEFRGSPLQLRLLLSNLMGSPYSTIILSAPDFPIIAGAHAHGELQVGDEEEEEEPRRRKTRQAKAAPAPQVTPLAGIGDGEVDADSQPKRGPGRPRKVAAQEAPAAVVSTATPVVPVAAPVPQPAAAPVQAAVVPQTTPAAADVNNSSSLLDEDVPAQVEPSSASGPVLDAPAEVYGYKLGDALRWALTQVKKQGVAQDKAFSVIESWVLSNHSKFAVMSGKSVDTLKATLNTSLAQFVNNHWSAV